MLEESQAFSMPYKTIFLPPMKNSTDDTFLHGIGTILEAVPEQ